MLISIKGKWKVYSIKLGTLQIFFPKVSLFPSGIVIVELTNIVVKKISEYMFWMIVHRPD